MSSKLVAQSEDNSAKEKKPDVDVRISRTGTISIKGITGSLEGAKPNAKKKHSIRSAVASLRGQALRQLRQQQGIEEKAQGSKKKELPNFSFASPNRLSQYSVGQPEPSDMERIARLTAKATLSTPPSPARKVRSPMSPSRTEGGQKLRHAVDVLHETVLDQRARAESRGITLSMALYRLEHRVRGDGVGAHALTRVREALREMDQQRETLLQQLADERLAGKSYRTKTSVKKLMVSWRNTRTRDAFNLWENLVVVHKANQMQSILSKSRESLITRLRDQLQAHTSHRVLVAWKSYVKTSIKEHAWEEKIREDHQNYTEMITRRAILRFRHGQISRCFNSFATNAKNEKERRVRVKRTLAKWTKRTLYRCFSAMSGYAASRKRKRNICHRVIAKVENQAAAAAMGKWRSFIMEDAKMRMSKERLIIKLFNGLTNKHEIQQIFTLVVAQVKQLMEAENALLFLHNPRKEKLYTKLMSLGSDGE